MTNARSTPVDARSTPVWMPLHIGDYVRDTLHLSTLEHGAYLLLILHAWENGGRLPTAERKLAKIARLPLQEWQEISEEIVAFFHEVDGNYHHKRIDWELEHASRLIEQKRAAGQASAEARARKKEGGNGGGNRSTGVAVDVGTDVQRSDNERTRQPQPQDSSVTDVTGGQAADPIKEIFDLGVSLLTAAGKSEAHSRSLIGRWRKRHGDDATRSAIDAAVLEGPSDPVEWIEGRFRHKSDELDATLDRMGDRYSNLPPLSVPMDLDQPAKPPPKKPGLGPQILIERMGGIAANARAGGDE